MSPLPLTVLALVVLAAACGGSQSSASPPPPGSPSPAATGRDDDPTASPAEPSDAPTTTPTVRPAPFDPATLTIDLEVVVDVPGRPVGVVAADDGSGRLFVNEQEGRIWIVRDGTRLERPFLDMSGLVRAGGEQGLLGLAFHPDHPADPRFFVYYTDRDGAQRVAVGRTSDDPDAADPDSLSTLLRMDDFAANHNGGALAFDPDGFLTIATGDGGGGGDPRGNGQRLNTYLGKILRIDVDAGATGDRPYGIPPDNPFLTTNGAFPEIWATGLRNPWRTTFDPATGDLWIGDVGQGRYEEIDVVRAGTGGQNFGWNVTEGFTCFATGEPCQPDGLTPPVTAYSHDLGCSVTGGAVYRGEGVPGLFGGYLFADYCSGLVWAIDSAADRVEAPTIVLESGRSLTAFGAGEDGELYVTDIGGQLLRVVGG